MNDSTNPRNESHNVDRATSRDDSRSARLGRWTAWAVLATIVLQCGCVPPDPIVDCSFTVRADSQPVPNAVVIAIPNRPRTDNDWELPYYFGQTDDEGVARLVSEAGGSGMLPGVYEVWVVERSDVRSEQTGSTLANVTYSTRRVTLVSSAVTPRFDLKHDSVRSLRNVEIADGGWASWLPVGSLVPGLESVQRGQP